MKLLRRFSLFATTALLFASSGLADTHPNVERGIHLDRTAPGDVDSINLFNGQLTLALPIGGTYPVGGGLSYGLTLTYTSKPWDFSEECDPVFGCFIRAAQQRRSNAGLGWTVSLARLESPTLRGNFSGSWVYIGPDGGEHVFLTTLHDGEPAPKGVRYTRDGSYLRMKDIDGIVAEVELPNGLIQTFTVADGELKQMRDRFGNHVDLTQSNGGLTWQLTDSAAPGRVQTINFINDATLGKRVSSITLATFGGTTATYTFSYHLQSIARPCPSYDPQQTSINAWLLDSVTLPDGSTYSIPAYNVTADAGSSCGLAAGLIQSLKLPTLGEIAWEYQPYLFAETSAPQGRPDRHNTVGVYTRTLKGASGTSLGSWQYDLSQLDPQERKTTVTTPLGHKTESFFSVSLSSSPAGWSIYEYGLPLSHAAADATGNRFLSSRTYAGCCTLLRSTYVRYERDGSPGPVLPIHSNQRLASTRTVYEDDAVAGSPQNGKRFADTNLSDFDGLGHYRTVQTGGNFDAGNVRTSYTRYNPSHGTYPGTFTMLPSSEPWLLEIVDRKDETEGTQTARQTFVVDASNGWVSRARVHRQDTGVESSQDVVIERLKDGTGNLSGERYYGGDIQTLGTGSLAILTLPQPPKYRVDYTTQYGTRATAQNKDDAGNPLSFKSLDQTIDPNTGLPSSSRDTSAIQTTYEYDWAGRLRFAKPPTGHDGWTESVYTRATGATALAQVNVYRRPDGGGTALAESLVKLDAFGRVWQQQQKMFSGTWSTRETLYNVMGWKASVSELGNTAKKTQYLDYDPFGRPGKITPPDGAGHDRTVIYSGVRSTGRAVKVADVINDEHGAWTTEIYDRQGRLYQVKEEAQGSYPTFTNSTTTYTYDVGNRISRVQQSTSAGPQNRWFTYDQRGFLISEQHPEKGASGDGLVFYTNYDARGHAGRRYECSGAACTDRMADLSFAYDPAERLTTVTDITLPASPKTLKSFVYGSSNAVGVRNNGKLQTATRYNYLGSPFNVTVQVAETYTYGGRQGRVSQKTTTNIFDGTNKESFSQSYTYNALGDVSHLDYPVCTYLPSCPASVPPGVDFTYTNGMLTAVPGFATSISYHPNGLFNQITHANSVVDTQTNDPNGMARPAALTATRLGSTLWFSGTYAYDGAGNVERMGNGYFLYDHVSRLIDAHIDDSPTGGGTLRYQTYTYDPFGNRTNMGGDPWAAGLPTPTSASNNRLNAATYDVAGNMKTWQGNSYEYDALSMMTRMVSGAEDWRYIYTADDERFWSYRVGGNGSLWYLRDLNGKVLRQYDAHVSWTTVRDYVYRDGQLLASNYPGEGTRHFTLDHLGTPRAITDSAGVAKVHIYFPYGEEFSPITLDVERMKFTGHERDFANPSSAADDLDYMHARHNNPQLGRFLSVDPLGGNPHAPQSWNLYAYTAGNPLKYVDPTGLAMTCATSIGGEVCTVTESANPLTGLQGLKDLQAGSGFQNSLFGDAGTREIGARVAATAGPPVNAIAKVLQAEATLFSFGMAMIPEGLVSLGAISAAGSVPAEINVVGRGLGHLVRRHTIIGAKTAGKSIFAPGENVVTLVKAAGELAPVTQANGNLAYVVLDAGRVIGTDVTTGAATSTYTVITDAAGNLVTGFPGLPW